MPQLLTEVTGGWVEALLARKEGRGLRVRTFHGTAHGTATWRRSRGTELSSEVGAGEAALEVIVMVVSRGSLPANPLGSITK